MSLPRPELSGVRWTPAHKLHATLRFLGKSEVSLINAAATALREVRHRPVEVILGPRVTKIGPRTKVLVVDARGLDHLAAKVVDATRDLGKPPPDRSYRGHVTIARWRHSRQAPTSYRASFSARFVASEIALVRSDPDGTYATVSRSRLAADC